MPLDLSTAWFCYENHAGMPNVSVTTGDTAFDDTNPSPVSHILDRLTYRVWQSPTISEYFEIDFGSDVSIQCLAVVFPRITNPYRRTEVQEIEPTDLIRNQLDADGGTPGSGVIFDSGSVGCKARPDRGYSIMALESAVSARYWRCQITANSRASKGFFLVALSMAGPIFQPSFNHIYGERMGFPDNSEAQRTPSGQSVFVTRNERTLTASLIWDFIPDSERSAWQAMDDFAGNTEPIVFAISNDSATPVTPLAGPSAWIMEPDRAFIGINQSDLSLSSRQFNASVKQIQLTEHR